MFTYKDMTFCANKKCTKECPRRLTPKIEETCKNEGWWYACAFFNCEDNKSVEEMS